MRNCSSQYINQSITNTLLKWLLAIVRIVAHSGDNQRRKASEDRALRSNCPFLLKVPCPSGLSRCPFVKQWCTFIEAKSPSLKTI